MSTPRKVAKMARKPKYRFEASDRAELDGSTRLLLSPDPDYQNGKGEPVCFDSANIDVKSVAVQLPLEGTDQIVHVTISADGAVDICVRPRLQYYKSITYQSKWWQTLAHFDVKQEITMSQLAGGD